MSKSRQQGSSSSALDSAIEHHQAGRLQQAEALYRKHPNNTDALNLLGVIAYQTGRFDEAVTLIKKAIRANPAEASYHYNLALAHRALGRTDEARRSYEQAVKLQPRYADALNNLGVLLREQGKHAEAAACYRRVIGFNPGHVDAINNLGAALRDLGQGAEALACCRQAVALNGMHVGALANLGAILNDAGQSAEALACSQQALAIDPHCVDAINNLAAALEDMGRLGEAADGYRSALALRPDSADLHFNLGRLLQKQGRMAEAISCFEQAIACDPEHAEAYNSAGALLQGQGQLGRAMVMLRQALEKGAPKAGVLTNIGTTLLNQGLIDEAIATLREALLLDPAQPVAEANLLFSHNYHPTMPAADIFGQYQRWDREHAVGLGRGGAPFDNPPDPARRLRIGYVSADFRAHTVMLFVGPLLEHHDRTQVEVFCYHNTYSFDAESARVKAMVDHFVPCRAMTDDELAARIAADGIDVLIDLSGHTADNRLLVFARSPAPVQVSWVGFGYTTGLSAMNYFIGDDVFTPPGCDALFSETVYRLPRSPWAYRPQAEAPLPGPLPARARGHVTFGCVSTTTRIHTPLFEAWAAILRRLPTARLRLDTRNLGDPDLCATYERRFAELGVPARQLQLGFSSPVWQVYQDIDIALDCFPHNSGTTTFEALWMGLPLITLADRPSVGRFGASILTAIGKQEWVATSAADYVERAVALAEDLATLEHTRASLRDTMRQSTFLDHAGFAAAMEAAYRAMWQHWCAGEVGDGEQLLHSARAHHQAGRLQQADALYASLPGNADARHLRGVIASQSGEHAQAVEHIAAAISADGGQARFYCNLGGAQQALGQYNAAIASYGQALALEPAYALAHNNLGNALQAMGEHDAALASYRAALVAQRDYAEAHTNLGSLLRLLYRYDEAIYHYRQALALDPTLAIAHYNLGNALLYQGRLDQAIASFELALAHGADPRVTFGNLLFGHNYHPTMAPEAIFAQYQRWNDEQARPLENALAPPSNAPDAARRLKVGYVSADFKNHSVIHFCAPLLEHHDHAQIELFCYHNTDVVDDQTRRMMAVADHWVPCAAMSDLELATRIRADGIDVLVDLSGHTLGNRLLAFARRPAPVQVSWMGFGYTTGLSAMDYFIGDDHFTPPGCEHLFSETVYRLPCAPWAYQPPAAAPMPGPVPARTRGHVTFVCVSATTRIHAPLLAAWAAILHQLPTARLRLDTAMFRDAGMRRDFIEHFAALGIPASQLDIGYTSPVWQVYQDADIVLDCFPHNCGTTTFEALWMGLPVVTLADRPSVGRFGASILAAVGRQQWVAASAEQYVALAVAMASDVDALERTRAALRQTMEQSSFLDHAGFARAMEAAYRVMWEHWCARQPGAGERQLRAALEHHQAGRLQQADALYQGLPGDANALHLRGVIASQTGQHALAIEHILAAINVDDRHARFYANLGVAQQALGQLDAAMASYRFALSLDPASAMAHNNLGNALKDSGQPEAAIASYQAALAVDPDYADAYSNLGSVLASVGRLDEAIASYQQAIALAPALAVARFNLGNVYHARMQFNHAIDSFLGALECEPQMYMAHNNLGLVLKDIGKLDDALICFDNALTIMPDDVNANSNRLFCVNYHPTMAPQDIFAAYQQWDRQQAARFAGHLPAPANERDPARRLRIGYVSADFRSHSVIHFAAPLLTQHDKAQVELFCYYNHSVHDAHTGQLVAAADHWIVCADMSDDELAARIRHDRIDVLVDISGHTLGNRLLVFARRAAPVQVSWMGFGYSTGLSAMDYFIGDARFTPPEADAVFSETIFRLPRAPWAYQPQLDAPAPGPLPARTRGYVTFACVGATTRLHAGLIEAWAAILRALPTARLRLDTRAFSDPDLCAEVSARFLDCGVASQQLQIGFTTPVWQVYQEADIVLDCFPHNCGTTTFEALWMGLPVVSVLDRPSVGRFGASILGAIGRQHWVAPDIASYVALAVGMAQDLDSLARERGALRRAMQDSPMLDHAGFARDMEAAYRAMWQQWCANPDQQGSNA